MIEFKTNYTPGPWKYCCEYVDMLDDCEPFERHTVRYPPHDRYSNLKFSTNKPDYLLYSMSPKMAEYMMARAKKISSDLKCDMFLLSPYDTRISVLNNELEEILTILKDAGIEVVYE